MSTADDVSPDRAPYRARHAHVGRPESPVPGLLAVLSSAAVAAGGVYGFVVILQTWLS